MVLKQRKHNNKEDAGPIQQQKQQQQHRVKKRVLDEKEETLETWSCWGIVQNILKFSFFVLLVPAFLNFAALGKEEKELKPEGI